VKARIAAALLCIAPGAGAADWNVAGLFELLARERPARATFHERKFLAILDRPVESSGELAFIPPDRLEKITVNPKPERVVVDRERVTLERGGKRHSMGLRDNPGVAVLVESIRATLAGDFNSLAAAYSVALDGPAQRWRLVLRPLDPTAATMVERIEIAGSLAQVKSVDIFQADGDRSAMTITPVAP